MKRTEISLTIVPSGQCRIECLVKIRLKNIGNQPVNVALIGGVPFGLAMEGEGVGPGCQYKRLEPAPSEMEQPRLETVALKPWEEMERIHSLHRLVNPIYPLITQCAVRISWKYRLHQNLQSPPEGHELVGHFVIPRSN